MNLFTQAKRFESMINMMLLPYSGLDPVAPFMASITYNYTQSIYFSEALVDVLADSGVAGEFIAISELDKLLDLNVTVPSKKRSYSVCNYLESEPCILE
jgi:hypothetical protein